MLDWWCGSVLWEKFGFALNFGYVLNRIKGRWRSPCNHDAKNIHLNTGNLEVFVNFCTQWVGKYNYSRKSRFIQPIHIGVNITFRLYRQFHHKTRKIKKSNLLNMGSCGTYYVYHFTRFSSGSRQTPGTHILHFSRFTSAVSTE